MKLQVLLPALSIVLLGNHLTAASRQDIATDLESRYDTGTDLAEIEDRDEFVDDLEDFVMIEMEKHEEMANAGQEAQKKN